MYKILICDDERDIRNALRIYLTSEGYAVCEADSGLAALELMQRVSDIALVVADEYFVHGSSPLSFTATA